MPNQRPDKYSLRESDINWILDLIGSCDHLQGYTNIELSVVLGRRYETDEKFKNAIGTIADTIAEINPDRFEEEGNDSLDLNASGGQD